MTETITAYDINGRETERLPVTCRIGRTFGGMAPSVGTALILADGTVYVQGCYALLRMTTSAFMAGRYDLEFQSRQDS